MIICFKDGVILVMSSMEKFTFLLGESVLLTIIVISFSLILLQENLRRYKLKVRFLNQEEDMEAQSLATVSLFWEDITEIILKIFTT